MIRSAVFSSPVLNKPPWRNFNGPDLGRGLVPRSSAGALYEVGSQALKNIDYLVSINDELPFGTMSSLTLDYERRCYAALRACSPFYWRQILEYKS